MIVCILIIILITSGVIASQDSSIPQKSQGRDNYPHLKAPANASPEKLKKFKERLNKLPLADYEATDTGDSQEHVKRLSKSQSYNHKIGKEDSRLKLVELGVIHNDWEFGLESSLPVAQSNAIVVGEVVAIRAFLSEDKTNVYSEFVMQVEEVIKNDETEPVAIGEQVIAERLGGRIRFPQGEIATYIVSGQFMPEEGQKYVFFLGYNRKESGPRKPHEMKRHLLTGYELSEGRVLPLDTAAGMFKQHEGKDATAFLGEIKQQVISITRVK